MSSVAGGIDGIEAVFDDASLVADAGLLLAGTVMGRLGLEALIDDAVRPPAAGRGSGAKALSVVASMLVGGSFIGDADRLRAGSASAVLGFEPAAPSTLGDVAAVLHLGPCAPVRPRPGAGAQPGVVFGRGAGSGGDDGGSGLHGL